MNKYNSTHIDHDIRTIKKHTQKKNLPISAILWPLIAATIVEHKISSFLKIMIFTGGKKIFFFFQKVLKYTVIAIYFYCSNAICEIYSNDRPLTVLSVQTVQQKNAILFVQIIL